MEEKTKNQKFLTSTLIIIVAVLAFVSYGHYFSKSSGYSQSLQQSQQSVAQNQATVATHLSTDSISAEIRLNDLENRINDLEIGLVDLDEKFKKSVELNIGHLEKSENLQKQVNMLEFTQVRQDIDINHLSRNCTSVAMESLSEKIERLQRGGVYPADTMSALENLFDAYVQECE